MAAEPSQLSKLVLTTFTNAPGRGFCLRDTSLSAWHRAESDMDFARLVLANTREI